MSPLNKIDVSSNFTHSSHGQNVYKRLTVKDVDAFKLSLDTIVVENGKKLGFKLIYMYYHECQNKSNK